MLNVDLVLRERQCVCYKNQKRISRKMCYIYTEDCIHIYLLKEIRRFRKLQESSAPNNMFIQWIQHLKVTYRKYHIISYKGIPFRTLSENMWSHFRCIQVYFGTSSWRESYTAQWYLNGVKSSIFSCRRVIIQ